MKAEKQLVILTTHFGTNFSGGSTATCEIFSRIQHEFESVVVVGTQLGKHPFQKLRFIRYRNWFHAIGLLRQLSKSPTVFYGDFYNAFLLVWARLPFFFTYHDNWPEMASLNLRNKLKALLYIPAYKTVFRKASQVFLVSESKIPFVSRYSSRFQVVKNGFTRPESDLVVESKSSGILMVGSVDQRKYKLALDLFESLPASFDTPINIYGHIRDEKIATRLKRFSFVTLRGFEDHVPYAGYTLLLHTSFMENLPLVFCEAIYHQVPVLAFDVGGSKEVVTPENGHLVPPYELDQMKSALMEILAKKKVFSINRKVLDLHSWDHAATIYRQQMMGT